MVDGNLALSIAAVVAAPLVGFLLWRKIRADGEATEQTLAKLQAAVAALPAALDAKITAAQDAAVKPAAESGSDLRAAGAAWQAQAEAQLAAWKSWGTDLARELQAHLA